MCTRIVVRHISPLAGDSSQPSYTQECTLTRKPIWLGVVAMDTLLNFTHLDYAHIRAFVRAMATYRLGVWTCTRPLEDHNSRIMVGLLLVRPCRKLGRYTACCVEWLTPFPSLPFTYKVKYNKSPSDQSTSCASTGCWFEMGTWVEKL